MTTGRVLITGGAGFLGSHLCDRYLTDGWDVVCVDNYEAGKRENIAHNLDNPHFTSLDQNITDGIELDGPLDLILHMASLASPPYYKRLPVETLMVGSVGTKNMLDLAVDRGARLLFASTSEVYGDPIESPQTESYWGNVNPIGPRSMYDESKRFGEALLCAYRNTRGADTAIIRIFNTYGPRMRYDDGRVVTNFISQIINGENLTIHGTGSQTRSFCFVSDLIEGIVRMAASSHAGPINLGNPHNEMTISELAERLCKLFNTPFQSAPPMPRQDENDPMQRCPDIALARDVLDWEPNVSFEEGMTATYDYLASALNG